MDTIRTKYCFYLPVLFMLSFLAASCALPDGGSGTTNDLVPVKVEVFPETAGTKAFSNPGSHSVNRVLLLPFKKVDESYPNDDSNFIPAYDLAVQKDVAGFPVGDATLYLMDGVTYKILIIGYNNTDFNFHNITSPANRFVLGSAGGTTTLANFHLYPKSPVQVPEFFVCTGVVYNGTTVLGEVFKPQGGLTVSGTLTRMVSAISVEITNVPGFVKSMTLSAENLVKASKARDFSVSLAQSAGDGGTRIINKKIPDANGVVRFSELLMPTFYDHRTVLYLDVELGGLVTERYVVKVPDSAVSDNNKLIFNPNQAINLRGSYSAINIGFTLGFYINLDENDWDGYN